MERIRRTLCFRNNTQKSETVQGRFLGSEQETLKTVVYVKPSPFSGIKHISKGLEMYVFFCSDSVILIPLLNIDVNGLFFKQLMNISTSEVWKEENGDADHFYKLAMFTKGYLHISVCV